MGCFHTFMNQLRAWDMALIYPRSCAGRKCCGTFDDRTIVQGLLASRQCNCLDHMILSDVVHESPLLKIGELVRGNLHVIGGSW